MHLVICCIKFGVLDSWDKFGRLVIRNTLNLGDLNDF